MISAWDIYWVSQLDTFIEVSTFIGITGFIVGVIFILIYHGFIRDNSEDKTLKGMYKFGKILMIPSVLFILIATILPSSKTAVAMWGVPKIVNNEDVREIPQNTAKLINEKLKSWMEDNLEAKKEK